MTRRTFSRVLEALDALACADDPRQAVQAVVVAVGCAARPEGVLVTSLSNGAPVAAWPWPDDFLGEDRLQVLEATTAAHPYALMVHTRTGPGTALRLSDVLSESEYRNCPVYVDLLRDLAVPRQVAFSVPTGPGRSMCVALARRGHDFTDAERDRLDALRGPLGTAARRDRAPAPPPAADRPVRALSRREGDVLRLVATGATDMQIGRRLGIAPRTVGKHLENVYRKIGTSNRTEAAALLHDADTARRAPADVFTSALQTI